MAAHILLELVIFYFLFISSKLTQASENVEFDSFLNLFENCTVNLYNYKKIYLSISRTPVIIQTGKSFRFEQTFLNQAKIPDNCITSIHILPTLENNNTDDGYNDFDPSYRLPKINTENRYNILLTHDMKNPDSIWINEYFDFAYIGRQSKGLIFQISNHSKTRSLVILDKFEIVNQFHISSSLLVTETADLKPILHETKRNHLDQAVANVNDFSTNNFIWSLRYSIQSVDSMRQGTRIQEIFRSGFIPTPADVPYIQHYGEGVENFVFVFTAFGANIDVEEFQGLKSHSSPPTLELRPTITFEEPYGPILTEQIKKELGFITCSRFGGPVYKLYTFPEIVQNVLSIFESRIYYAAILSYVVPPILLGVMYHWLLKKRIRKEYRITWHPFTWGLRALVWQAGDRRLDSNLRFGWTTFMVVPWLLVAVIISYIFRSHVLRAISSQGRLVYPGNPIKAMYDSGVNLITDNDRLARYVPEITHQRIDWKIRDDLSQNSDIAFIGWMDDIEKINDSIGWGCKNSWGPPKVGHTFSSDLSFLSGYMYDLEATVVKGWMISNWVDNRILARLKALDGPSGIVAKWREVLKKPKGNSPWSYFGGAAFVYRIGMMGNILYVFYCGAGALVGALVVWIVEWVFYAVYTRPKRKWTKEMELEKKLILREQVQLTRDSRSSSVLSNQVLEDKLLQNVVEITEEEIKMAHECNFSNEA